MAAAVDTRNAGANGTGASISWTHTVTGGLSNTVLVVGATTAQSPQTSVSTVSWNGSTAGWSKTVNGVAATQNDSTYNGFAQAELWYLKAPTAGSFQIVVTPVASSEITGGSVSVKDVDQSTTFNAASPQKNARATNVNPTTAVTSAAGEFVIDCTCLELSGAAPTAVVGGGQNQIFNRNNGSGTSMGFMSDEGGAASVTMDWTGLTSSNPGTGQVSISLKAAAGGVTHYPRALPGIYP